MQINLVRFARTRRRALVALTALLALAGCSTPQAALDQANHTVKLMSLLELQLAEFRRVHAAAEEARLASLETQKAVSVAVEVSAALDLQAKKSAGDTVQEPLRQKILADADALATLQAGLVSAKRDYDKKLAALLAPLPSTTVELTAAQAQAAKMGVNLSRDARTQELLGFAKDIVDSIKANQEKIKEARAQAAKTDTEVTAAVLIDVKSVRDTPLGK